MSLLSYPLHSLMLLVASLFALEAHASQANAAPAAEDNLVPAVAAAQAMPAKPPACSLTRRVHAAPPPAVALGSLSGQILGNRSRMIQMAFLGFAIGIAILVTATRKY